MEFLNKERVVGVWDRIKTALAEKQDKITGIAGQIAAFDGRGNLTAQAVALPNGIATLDSAGVLEAAQRPSLAQLEGGCNPNLLDNWYFVNPINQRRQTEYATDGYAVDRWIIIGKLSVLNNAIQLTGDGTGQLCQRLEPAVLRPGGTYTLSVLVDELLGNAQMGTIGGDTKPLMVGLNSLTFTANSSTCTGILPVYRLSGSCKVKGVKLEERDIQSLACREGDAWILNAPTPVEQAVELRKCQRYFYNSRTQREDGRSYLYSLFPITPYTLQFAVLPVEMRVLPAVTIYNNAGMADAVMRWENDERVPVTAFAASKKSIRLNINGTEKVFVMGSAYNFGLEASADL